MLSRLEIAFGVLFFGALALSWVFPNSGPVGLAFLALVILGTPFFVLAFGRTLYTAVRMGYVVPGHAEGPVYRSEKPVMFWSNVVLSTVFIPVIIGGGFLIAGEAMKLAEQIF